MIIVLNVNVVIWRLFKNKKVILITHDWRLWVGFVCTAL